MEIAALLADLHTYAFAKDWAEVEGECIKIYASIGRLQTRAHVGEAFQSAKVRLLQLCKLRVEGKITDDDYPDYALLRAIHAYLHGEITPEALALQLPNHAAQ